MWTEKIESHRYPKEKEERIKYRNLYMTNFRANFKNHLDSIKVKYVDENGNEIKGN